MGDGVVRIMESVAKILRKDPAKQAELSKLIQEAFHVGFAGLGKGTALNLLFVPVLGPITESRCRKHTKGWATFGSQVPVSVIIDHSEIRTTMLPIRETNRHFVRQDQDASILTISAIYETLSPELALGSNCWCALKGAEPHGFFNMDLRDNGGKTKVLVEMMRKSAAGDLCRLEILKQLDEFGWRGDYGIL